MSAGWIVAEVDPAGVQLALARDGAVWRSTDGGARWDVVLAAPRRERTWDLAGRPPDADEPDEIADLRARGEGRAAERALWSGDGAWWVVRSDGVFRTDDLGRRWAPAEGAPPPPSLGRYSLAPAPIRTGARWLPALSIELAAGDGRAIAWTPDPVPVSGRAAGWLAATVSLVFTPPRPAAQAPEPGVDRVAVGGRWFVVDGAADPVLARAVARELGEDRARRAARLAALREAEVPASGGDLRARVLAELRRRELAALRVSREGT